MKTANHHCLLAFLAAITTHNLALQAQTAGSGDSIVQITAENCGLTPIPAGEAVLPRLGTFWIIQPGFCAAAPLPFAPPGSFPTFQVVDNQYLIDMTVSQNLPSDAAKAQAMLAAEANAVVNLVNQIQGEETLRETEALLGITHPDLPPPNTFSYTVNSNLLWLQLTNVAAGTVYANLMDCTNQSGVPGTTNLSVYAIWSATNLSVPFAAWQVETEVWPDNTNCMPFTVARFSRPELFCGRKIGLPFPQIGCRAGGLGIISIRWRRRRGMWTAWAATRWARTTPTGPIPTSSALRWP